MRLYATKLVTEFEGQVSVEISVSQLNDGPLPGMAMVIRDVSRADTLRGGSGIDTADYESADVGVTANLSDASQNTFSAAGDTYVSIENLRGSNFDDVLTGNGGDNTIEGLKGNDILTGGNGNDRLLGQENNDQINGGAGNDVGAGGVAGGERDSFFQLI